MRKVILVGSKHGHTLKCARQLNELSGHLFEILKPDQLTGDDLCEIDTILIGSSLYAGMIDKNIRTFVEDHAKLLGKINGGLFLCGLNEDHLMDAFANNYPKSLLDVWPIAYLGGGLKLDELHFFESLIVKLVLKKKLGRRLSKNEEIDFVKEKNMQQLLKAVGLF